MIPVDLQDGVVARVKKILASSTFKNPKYRENPTEEPEFIPINVFPQHLPQKESSDTSLYPFILVQLLDGTQSTETEQMGVSLQCIVGTYDNNKDYQGYRDLCSILQKIYEDLIRNPNIDDRFEMVFPIDWFISDESPFPYNFGAVTTNWNVPKALREDVQHLI